MSPGGLTSRVSAAYIHSWPDAYNRDLQQIGAVLPDIPTDDDRSSLARGWALSTTISTIALEMVLPGMLGFYIDIKLGTTMVFLVLGLVVGFVAGMIHLMRLAKSLTQTPGGPGEEKREGNSRPS
jgi:F0F1-type ATP synthase assembly protein I